LLEDIVTAWRAVMKMTNLTLQPDCLYVFIDDTGHEHLAGSDFYGLGGCAVMGRDYERLIAGPWAAVRLLAAGNEHTPLHAAPFGRKSSPQQKAAVVQYFRQQPIRRIGAAGATTTIVPEQFPLMQLVVESLKQRIVAVAKWMSFKSITVIFEDNPRANGLISAYFGDARFRLNGKEVPTDFYFLPKRAHDPALEVADFIANAIGGHARRTLVENNHRFGQDFRAIFHNIDWRGVSFMGIERVDVGEPEPRGGAVA
jgi:hypothetical protein